MKNGRSHPDDPKVTSLDAARKAAAKRARAASQPARGSLSQRIIGFVLLTLVVAAVVHYGRMLLGLAGVSL